MKVVISFVVLVVILMIGLNLMRSYDELYSYRNWKKLEKVRERETQPFSLDMVENLPVAAQRYFKYTIKPGTPLKYVAHIKMGGRLGLGPKNAPDYMEMEANQILSLPQGFIWNVKTGRGSMVVTGSEGVFNDTSWSRFWLMHAIPIGRAGGRSSHSKDHHRAAFGRLVAEAVIWSPAALLPSETVSWEDVGPRHARARVKFHNRVQIVDIYINDAGQPTHVMIPRWSDANASNSYQEQPFGGYLSVYKEFDGYRLPTHVEVGNFIGTDDYFPFYIADVESISFID